MEYVLYHEEETPPVFPLPPYPPPSGLHLWRPEPPDREAPALSGLIAPRHTQEKAGAIAPVSLPLRWVYIRCEMVDSNGNYVRVNENPSGNSKSGVTDGGRTSAGDGFTARPEGFYEGNSPSASNQNDAKPVSPNVDFNIAQGVKNVKTAPVFNSYPAPSGYQWPG